MRALAECVLAGGGGFLGQRHVGRGPGKSGRELVHQRQPRALRLLRLQRPVLIDVHDFALHPEGRRVVGSLDQQFLIRLHGAAEVALIAKTRGHAAQHLNLVRGVAAGSEEMVGRFRATDLGERHGHIVQRLVAQAESRLAIGRQLVVGIDQPAEYFDRFAVAVLVLLRALVVVRPSKLVERQEVDVADRRRGGSGLLVGSARFAEQRLALVAARRAGKLEPRVTQPEHRLRAQRRRLDCTDLLEHRRGVGVPLARAIQRAERVLRAINLREGGVVLNQLFIAHDRRRVVRMA